MATWFSSIPVDCLRCWMSSSLRTGTPFLLPMLRYTFTIHCGCVSQVSKKKYVDKKNCIQGIDIGSRYNREILDKGLWVSPKSFISLLDQNTEEKVSCIAFITLSLSFSLSVLRSESVPLTVHVRKRSNRAKSAVVWRTAV